VAGRLEWVPQETLAYSGCLGGNELRADLQPGGSLLATEVLGLGLPEANQPFKAGQLTQHLEISGLWLDRGVIAAKDDALLQGPCGLAGHRVLGTLLLAQSAPLPTQLADGLLADARSCIEASGLTAAATFLHERLVLVRLLAQEQEPAMALLQAVRNAWRKKAWGLAVCEPRIWAT
jgi:urease accessory protein